MKQQVWIISQDNDQVILVLRIKRLHNTLYAYDESGTMEKIAEYENEHETVEAMRDFIKYLKDESNIYPYKMKQRGFDTK